MPQSTAYRRLVPLFLTMQLAPTARAAQPAGDEIPANFSGIESAIVAYEAEHPGQTLTIEALLQRLPADFRSSFALMYASGSTQPATPEQPRVLMFGDDARTVLAFNAATPTLEIASADAASGELSFRRLEFPASGEGHVQISASNPPACANCHGVQPHYIWGSYIKWSGAYGSLDDVIALGPNEPKTFAAFRSAAPAAGRYRSLIFAGSERGAEAPYRSLRPGRSGTRRFDYSNAIEQRPNFRLGALLQRHQAAAAVGGMAKQPSYGKLKHGLTYFLSGCEQHVDADQHQALVASNGLDSYTAYAQALGAVPALDWQFKRHPVTDAPADYNASPVTFRAALTAKLWETDLSYDAQLSPYYRPLRFGPFVRSGDPGVRDLYAADRGLTYWDKIDEAGVTVADFAGGEEMHNLFVMPFRLPHLSPAEVGQVCSQLAQKQLAE